jgi:hypothetical protein
MNPIASTPIWARPQPEGGTIWSELLRLAAANDIATTAGLRALLGLSHYKHALMDTWAAPGSLIGALAALMAANPRDRRGIQETLILGSAWRFGSPLALDWRSNADLRALRRHPFLGARPGVCPTCLGDNPFQRRVEWSLPFVTVCPLHQVELLEKCPEGAPVGGTGLHGPLPRSPSTHPRAASCPGCDLRRVPARRANEDDINEQRQLMEDLGLTSSPGYIRRRNERTSQSFALLELGLLLSGEPAASGRTGVRREIRSSSIRDAVHLAVAPRDSAVAMVEQHVSHLLDLGQRPPNRVAVLLGQTRLAGAVSRRSAITLEAATLSCRAIATRHPNHPPAERLLGIARALGILPIHEDPRADWVVFTSTDAATLSTATLTCLNAGCSGKAVEGAGDYLLCRLHEFRCGVRGCQRLASSLGGCSIHRGEGPVWCKPEERRVALSDWPEKSFRPHKLCAAPGCERQRNPGYRFYCTNHGSLAGLDSARRYCRELGCVRWLRKDGYCAVHRPARVQSAAGVQAREVPRQQLKRAQASRRRVHMCGAEGCTRRRAYGYGRWCRSHGRELLQEPAVGARCVLGCGHESAAQGGYCYHHARLLGIHTPKMCRYPGELCFRGGRRPDGMCSYHRVLMAANELAHTPSGQRGQTSGVDATRAARRREATPS